MYIYNISQYEPIEIDIYLYHEKQFTQQEFCDLCGEAYVKTERNYVSCIYRYLRDNYGFKNINDLVEGYYECDEI